MGRGGLTNAALSRRIVGGAKEEPASRVPQKIPLAKSRQEAYSKKKKPQQSRRGTSRKKQFMKILDVPQSGSVGARTSSHNRSGQYVRQRAIPTQPRTASQIAARSRLTTAAAAWRGLTGAQQAAWNAFAQSFTVVNSLGTSIHLTGLQSFTKVQCVLNLLGLTATTTPPSLPAFAAISATGITAVSATPLISIQGTTPTGSATHMIFASPQLSPGVTFCGIFRYIQNVSTYTAGSATLQTAYAAKFGALIAGKKIFVRAVQQIAGMQDRGTLFSCIVS